VAERSSEDTVVEAAASTIWEIITDFESYPDWVENMKAVEVRETDSDGRPSAVWFHVDARVMEIEYVLSYEYPEDERRMTWTLQEAEQLRQLDGEYLLEEEGDEGPTRVNYSLEVDLAVPVPGFLKKRAARVIMETGLGELKRRAESIE
jgi:ribosome-associated toxin RatA of RatAB toxin-antitoxin module